MLWIWFPSQIRIYFFHTVLSLHLKEHWGWKIEACFLFLTGALGRLSNQSNNSVGFMPGTCQSKIIIANPLCYQSKGYWGWQGQAFFKCLYCAYLVLCLGEEELLWTVLVDFFSIRWQLTELLNLPQRASFIGLLRKQPRKKVGGGGGEGRRGRRQGQPNSKTQEIRHPFCRRYTNVSLVAPVSRLRKCTI